MEIDFRKTVHNCDVILIYPLVESNKPLVVFQISMNSFEMNGTK